MFVCIRDDENEHRSTLKQLVDEVRLTRPACSVLGSGFHRGGKKLVLRIRVFTTMKKLVFGVGIFTPMETLLLIEAPADWRLGVVQSGFSPSERKKNVSKVSGRRMFLALP